MKTCRHSALPESWKNSGYILLTNHALNLMLFFYPIVFNMHLNRATIRRTSYCAALRDGSRMIPDLG